MKLCLIYHMRLGDVIQCLPLAKRLHDLGHEAYIECNPEYHGIFECVSYARPLLPGGAIECDHALDLQIWPNAYKQYRESKLTWSEWVHTRFFAWLDELSIGEPVPLEGIRFTTYPTGIRSAYGLPRRYNLVSPFGYSQVERHDPRLLADFVSYSNPEAPTYYLTPPGLQIPAPSVCASKLSHLLALIQDAEVFGTINSAPTYIASAVRSKYLHIRQADFGHQDDFRHVSQVVLEWSDLLTWKENIIHGRN